MSGVRLGIDFGTSTTVAVLAGVDGPARPLVFDGSELMPSAVCATPDGTLVVGRDAIHMGRVHPAGFEPSPKRCLHDGTVLLAGREFRAVDLVAAVLRRVGAEARNAAGGPLGPVTLTCPSGWGAGRRQALAEAAAEAGLGTVGLVPEPVAAARYYLDVLGGRLPPGSVLVVYDFGAGTFDASVLTRTAAGFSVLATRGLPDVGGLDIDAAIVGWLGRTQAARHADARHADARHADARHADARDRLRTPVTTADLRIARALWDDVRAAKEMLSRTSTTVIHIPVLDVDVPLTRFELEDLIRPILDRTIATTRAAVRDAGAEAASVAAVFHVGGSARIPLAATLLHRAFGVAPTVVERPELVVAEGGLRGTWDEERAATPPVAEPPREPPGTPPPAPVPEPEPDARPRRRRLAAAVVVAVVVLLALAALTVLRPWQVHGRATGITHPFVGVVANARGLRVAFSPDGRYVATPDQYDVVLWDTVTGRRVRTLTGRPSGVATTAYLAFSRDGKRLMYASNVWDTGTGEIIRILQDTSYGLALSPDGAILAVASGFTSDPGVRLWSVDSGARTRTLATTWATNPAFSPDGATLVAFTREPDGCGVWDTATGAATRFIPDCGGFLAVGPGGLMVAAGSGVNLWNTRTDTHRTLTTVDTRFAALNDAGTVLAVVNADSAVQLWDPVTGQLRQTIRFPGDGSVDAVALSPDGHTIALIGSVLRLADLAA